MYQAHWGLRESPFCGAVDARFFYRSPTHEEALARLYFLVEQRRRLGLLLGPAGSGKTLLLAVFAGQLRRSGRPVAKINLVGVQPGEVLPLIGAAFGLNLDPAGSPAVLWRAVADRLAEYRYQQLETVVLLDDADLADRAVLTQVARLAQHDPSPESRLTVVLAGRQDRTACLGERLLDLADLRIDLALWEPTETAEFLSKSLAEAGRQRPVFDEPAITRLHELSHGIPRRVNQLAELALLAGAGRQVQQIDAELVESVYRELAVVEA